MENEKKICPVVKVDGLIASGKQYDLDITIPNDNRNVIYGVVKDCYKDPIENAVVKLIEISYEHGFEERKPVSHTFTNEAGEFVFGPLCPKKFYEVNIWVNEVKHVKICAKCKHDYSNCLKGVDIKKCDYMIDSIPDCTPDSKPDCKPCSRTDSLTIDVDNK